MSSLLQENSGELNLGENDYNEIRSEISSYLSNASDMEFQKVYEFQSDVNTVILDLVNQNLIEQLDSATETGNALFTRYNAATAGVVEYYVDGFETATVDGLDASWFDRENYSRQDLRAESLVSSGDPVYKLVTSEEWQLIFPLDEEMESYILGKMEANQRTAEDGTVTQGKTYIEIQFDKDDASVWPSVTVEYRDGQAYGVLSFINSMVRYAGQRYLDFEVLRSETEGLKIPKSAVTENSM